MRNHAKDAYEAPSAGGRHTQYVYDGDGRRVMKITENGPTQTYVFDMFGTLVAEYSSQPSGTPPPCNTCYLSTDHLGNTRMVTDGNHVVVARHDYTPFGEEIPAGYAGRGTEWGGYDAVNQKFTAKERDQETGLDYFGARYMSSAQGRFTSPDPHSGDILHVINPQRWNMYAYGLNNPLAYTDPTGKDAIAVTFSKEIPVVGHAGIISLHHDGMATYARYGPVSEGMPFDEGHTSVVPNLPNVTFDGSGNPTQASFNELAKAVAKFEGQDPKTVNMAFFQTSEADTAALDNWIREQYKRKFIKNSQTYSFLGNSCTDFCARGLMIGGARADASAFSAVPNLMMSNLWLLANATYSGKQQSQSTGNSSVTSKFCYTDEQGKRDCQ